MAKKAKDDSKKKKGPKKWEMIGRITNHTQMLARGGAGFYYDHDDVLVSFDSRGRILGRTYLY